MLYAQVLMRCFYGSLRKESFAPLLDLVFTLPQDTSTLWAELAELAVQEAPEVVALSRCVEELHAARLTRRKRSVFTRRRCLFQVSGALPRPARGSGGRRSGLHTARRGELWENALRVASHVARLFDPA